jgi:hypothetical protein
MQGKAIHIYNLPGSKIATPLCHPVPLVTEASKREQAGDDFGGWLAP